jgi:hypothetical protein
MSGYRFRHCEMPRSGVEACVIIHHPPLNKAAKDLARRAITEGADGSDRGRAGSAEVGQESGRTASMSPQSPTPRASVLSSHAGRIPTWIPKMVEMDTKTEKTVETVESRNP